MLLQALLRSAPKPQNDSLKKSKPLGNIFQSPISLTRQAPRQSITVNLWYFATAWHPQWYQIRASHLITSSQTLDGPQLHGCQPTVTYSHPIDRLTGKPLNTAPSTMITDPLHRIFLNSAHWSPNLFEKLAFLTTNPFTKIVLPNKCIQLHGIYPQLQLCALRTQDAAIENLGPKIPPPDYHMTSNALVNSPYFSEPPAI